MERLEVAGATVDVAATNAPSARALSDEEGGRCCSDDEDGGGGRCGSDQSHSDPEDLGEGSLVDEDSGGEREEDYFEERWQW